ncbi:MAG: hypothetical protein J5I99_00365 [Verrucomicrobia bacterium]|nr:hypothetical protein [Kiritimatiellia bacterium]MCO6399665.1 hypothetical protein [Verrucomicrobiota bacterium]
MKILPILLATALITPAAMAQSFGLPIASSASAPAAGATALSGGAVLSDTFNLYGGALSFAPVSRLSLFGQLGALDPDHGDLGYAAQGGIQFALPLRDSAVDLALRGTWSHFAYDSNNGDVSANGFNLGAIVSRDMDLISPYVFIGLNFNETEVKQGHNKQQKDEIDPAAAFGFLLHLGSEFSLYAEIAHVDDLAINFGLTRKF